MPLNQIPYQPLGFETVRPNASCVGDDNYCQPFIPTDRIMAQFKQTPCQASLICDGDFENFTDNEVVLDQEFDNLESNIITNGTFTGNANGWSLPAGWVYGGNMITKAGTGTVQTFAQVIPATVPNAIYKVTFDIANYGGSGDITPYIYAAPSVFATGAVQSGNGTKVLYIKSASFFTPFSGIVCTNIAFGASSLFTGDIDNIKMERVAYQWEFGDSTGVSDRGWTIDDATGYATSIGANTTKTLRQNGIIQPGVTYTVEIVFDGATTGFITANVGGTQFGMLDPTGTVTFTIIGGTSHNDFWLLPFGGGYDGQIISISIITDESVCWDYDNTHWTVSDLALCHTPGTPDALINSTIFDAGLYYVLEYTISNMTAGAVAASISNIVDTTRTDNGTYKLYASPTATGQVAFSVSADFDGCISAVAAFELRNDYIMNLLDLDENLVALLGGFVTYYKDFVTLNALLSDIVDNNSNPIPYGCYKLWVYDFCELQYFEILSDGVFSNPFGFNWFNVGIEVGAQSISGGQLRINIPGGSAPIFQITRNCNPSYPDCTSTEIRDGANYKLEFDVIELSDVNNLIGGHIGNIAFNNIAVTTAPTALGHHILYINNVQNITAGQDFFNLYFDIKADGLTRVDNVSLQRIEPFDVTYVSQCIIYGESFNRTKIIEGYCDNEAFGFEFENSGFKLSQRIGFIAITPNYPEDTTDYQFSSGTKSRYFGKSEKYWEFFSARIPEHVHDCLRLQRICDTFNIGDVTTDMVKYISKQGDYNPQFDKTGSSDLAVVKFDISLSETDTKYNSNK